MGVLKNIEIAGTDLSEFNCRIVNPGLFDAPERDVTKVSIPGRSGDLLLDNGRFKNVTVEYDCLIESDDAVRDFNNLVAWLKSLTGYQRIEERFHPDEYRLGIFNASITAKTADRRTINFKLKADCKPQRFLVEGEIDTTRYIVLDLYQAGAKWQAAAIFNTGGRIYDLTTKDPAAAFADVLTVKLEDIGNLTIGSDNKGAFIDLTANGLVTTDGTGVVVRMENNGNDFLFEFDTGAGVYYASNTYTLTNPTPYTTSPLLEFVVTNGAWIYAGLQAEINGIHITAEPAAEFTGVLYVDSEVADSYYIDNSGTKVNANNMITLTKGGTETTDFPVLTAGNNSLSFYRVTANPSNSYGGHVQIRPRWYTI